MNQAATLEDPFELRPARVCLFIHHLSPGGAQRQCLELARDLTLAGADVTVFTLEEDDGNTRPEHITAHYPEIEIITATSQSRLYQNLSGALKFAGRLRKRRGSAGEEKAGAWTPETPNLRPAHILQRRITAPFLTRWLGDSRLGPAIEEASRFPSVLVHLRSLEKQLRAERYDLVVSFLTKANTIAAMAGCVHDIPVVVCERNDVARQHHERLDRLRNVSYPLTSLITANTNFACRELENRFPLHAVEWLPNSSAYRVASSTGPSGGREHAVIVSRLEPQKRVAEIVRAFASSELHDITMELHIFGAGSEYDSLRDLVRGLGLEKRVSLHGFVAAEEIPLSRFQYFVSNSAFEGSSNSLHEALESGLVPVLAQEIAEVDEILSAESAKAVVIDSHAKAIGERLIWWETHPDQRENLRARIDREYQDYRGRALSARNQMIARLMSLATAKSE